LIDIAVRRLQTQRLVGEPFASVVDAVAWLGAVQAQDYAAAKWALGQRTSDALDADLDRLELLIERARTADRKNTKGGRS